MLSRDLLNLNATIKVMNKGTRAMTGLLTTQLVAVRGLLVVKA